MYNRFERRVRSRFLGLPFVATNAMTRFEIFGQANLLAALERRRASGRGLITISNHQSLFDDPMVLCAVLGLRDLTVETKKWWSTPCQTNFSPRGTSLRDRFVRTFSDVSKMVFFARRSKNEQYPVPPHYLEALAGRDGGDELLFRIQCSAASRSMDGESYLRRFVTPGDSHAIAALNQLGMIEACARVDLGDWLHFFPEATRCRELELGVPKRGVGKILYHCEQADVLPICFCGMHTVLPVGATLPRPLQRVVIFVGEPVPAHKLARLRAGAPGPDRFQTLAAAAWEPVQSLWPLALARYRRQRPLVTPFSLPQRRAERIDDKRSLVDPTSAVPPRVNADAPVAPPSPAS